MGYRAVITGDLVKSSKIKNADIQSSLSGLKEAFQEINTAKLKSHAKFEIFRGDSFQIVISDIKMALLVAVLIRAHMRSFVPLSQEAKRKKTEKKTLHNAYSDVRISIGIGEIDYSLGEIAEWQGEAFRKSGEVFDEKLIKSRRLWVNTPWEKVNAELEVEILLLDGLIKKWTGTTSRTMYRYLLYKEKQSKLATYFGISQPSINRRLVKYGDSEAVDAALERYAILMESSNESN